MNSVLGNFDQTLHPSSQHTGYYDDPDMLTVGMTGLTAAQNQTHMSLWAISGASLAPAGAPAKTAARPGVTGGTALWFGSLPARL